MSKTGSLSMQRYCRPWTHLSRCLSGQLLLNHIMCELKALPLCMVRYADPCMSRHVRDSLLLGVRKPATISSLRWVICPQACTPSMHTPDHNM